jgi:hypothetical protein
MEKMVSHDKLHCFASLNKNVLMEEVVARD